MRDMEELIQNDALFAMCMWLLLIVIVCRVVWWIYSNILERKLNINKGIPLTGYTPEEVAVIVRKNLVCPFVEEIGEDEQGGMFFQCKSERYFSRIESGRFSIRQKKRSWVNPDFLSEEGWELQFCIGDIFSENPGQDRETYAKRKQIMRWGSFANWIAGGIFFLCFAYMFFQMARGEDILKSRGVCLAQFTAYSSDYTIDEALWATCVEGEWSSFKEEGITYACFAGTTYNGGTIKMIFQMDIAGTCEIISIQVDGINYAGTIFGGAIMEGMYSNIK